MSAYLLSFRGQPGRTVPEDAQEKWTAWFGELGSSVLLPGSRVGQSVVVPADEPGDAATAVPTGFMVVTADDVTAAAELARGCPGLATGISVEVGELLEM